MTPGHRISLLWEYYGETLTAERAESLLKEVESILTDHVKIGKVTLYVEANPPEDEVT